MLLAQQSPVTDRAGHVLRFLAIPAAVIELDRRVERLARALDHGRPVLRTPRSRHDLVGDPPLVERLLHPPTRAEPPRGSAAMQLHWRRRQRLAEPRALGKYRIISNVKAARSAAPTAMSANGVNNNSASTMIARASSF